jgi:polysaccharide deacetylase family sporulation protein PdaB
MSDKLKKFLIFSVSAPVFAASSQVVSKVNTTAKVVALTFDDGSDGAKAQKILQILSQNNIKSTFFLTGEAAEQHPQLIKNIVAQGHEIGNHSYSHPYFTQISSTMMKEELNKTETIIKSLTGLTTKPLFRAPYGAYNSSVLQAVGEVGYTKTIMWTIDTVDWTGNSANEITQRVLNNISPGSIVLMHVASGTNTTVALPGMISSLKSMGYSFVTVSQLLNYSSSTIATGDQYIVKAGDTLSKIAAAYGVTVQQIVTANNIPNANLIYPNQVLIIPK